TWEGWRHEVVNPGRDQTQLKRRTRYWVSSHPGPSIPAPWIPGEQHKGCAAPWWRRPSPDSRLREAGAEVVYCLTRGAPKGPNLPRARLNRRDALFPGHGKATHSQTWVGEPAWLGVLSLSTATALRFLIKSHGWSQDFLSAAWVFEQVKRWFDLMNSRHPVITINKHNLAIFTSTIEFLTIFHYFQRRLKIGNWAFLPEQPGVVLSTKSVLNLQKMLIYKHSFSFALTPRFTQDCLENLFSVVRQDNPIPIPLECKMAPK
ncbi:hypothetical protein HPB47_018403, partial [Ixodes persulcatus]